MATKGAKGHGGDAWAILFAAIIGCVGVIVAAIITNPNGPCTLLGILCPRTSDPKPAVQIEVKADNTYLVTSPTFSGRTISVAKKGESFPVLAKVRTFDWKWYYLITMDNDQRAWVVSSDVKLVPTSATIPVVTLTPAPR